MIDDVWYPVPFVLKGLFFENFYTQKPIRASALLTRGDGRGIRLVKVKKT